MRRRDDPEVDAWLAKAKGDLKMAELAWAADTPLWDQACFHAQQCAEKSLKALLVAAELEVPRTHDLVALVDRLKRVWEDIECLANAAGLLSHYGVAPRYPSFLASETETDAREALDRAREFLAFAVGRIGK
jgi:HEPN domain-containing protein